MEQPTPQVSGYSATGARLTKCDICSGEFRGGLISLNFDAPDQEKVTANFCVGCIIKALQWAGNQAHLAEAKEKWGLAVSRPTWY